MLERVGDVEANPTPLLHAGGRTTGVSPTIGNSQYVSTLLVGDVPPTAFAVNTRLNTPAIVPSLSARHGGVRRAPVKVTRPISSDEIIGRACVGSSARMCRRPPARMSSSRRCTASRALKPRWRDRRPSDPLGCAWPLEASYITRAAATTSSTSDGFRTSPRSLPTLLDRVPPWAIDRRADRRSFPCRNARCQRTLSDRASDYEHANRHDRARTGHTLARRTSSRYAYSSSRSEAAVDVQRATRP